MSGESDRSAPEISKELAGIIKKKSEGTIPAMLLLGILAGCYIGFGSIAATTVSAHAAGLPVTITKWLAGSVFCVGLILVIIPGSELFTGNMLMVVAVLRRSIPLSRILRSWTFVYVGNFAGAFLLAWAMYGTGLMGTAEEPTTLGAKAAGIAATKIALPFWAAFFRGVLCNMLVCLAVLMAIAARTVQGKIAAIYFPIMVFVLCGFEHSVANMYFLPAGLMAKGTILQGREFLSMFNNIIPVTLGNMVGGFLVILLHPNRLRQLRESLVHHHK